MKKNIGTSIASIGMLFSILGITILENYKILQYTALSLGVLLSIYGVYKEAKDRETQEGK